MEDEVTVAAVMVVSSVHPFPLAFWYCFHLVLSVLQCINSLLHVRVC